MEVSGQLHAPAALTPRKSQWYPLDRRLDGPKSRSGRGGEEKNSQPLPLYFITSRIHRHLTNKNPQYEGVSKSFRIDLITK